MMLLPLILLASVQDGAPPVDDGADIVVVAERMKRIKLSLSRKGDVLRKCRVRESSGDPAIDGFACQAVAECLSEGNRKSDPLEACATKRTLAFYRARRAGMAPVETAQ
ncbi:hypothetical protein NYR55_07200 [Sphingomonas sp. BGYR3]|uniref:hypothetical protein n=1 Tax=Sphingomonas sp. BGYR3 TaxID=2975483 RepID=UPI0021A4A4C7|nr:hypothetical protein [Sphingomonas sp. BGYR3]MDG5488406.1 hypothetical protein [Sphingomonas sp. BGYR3]